MTPVTNHDFTPEACAERVQKLLDAPPLKVALVGGGIESELFMDNDAMVLIHRDELREIIRHLTRPMMTGPDS